MNESELRSKWTSEKLIYERWGQFIISKLSEELERCVDNLDQFLKIPPRVRVKTDASLVDKAFYRKKNYEDPYNDIEDKVGIRFVVLLIEDIEIIRNIVVNADVWEYDECRNFEAERRKDPLLFTYQSVHFVLRPKTPLTLDGHTILSQTACELQIRTLLQHAHAELTHDSIYKSERTVKPNVHRTVAKSMALIETTDEFFSSVTRELNYGPLQEYRIVELLDSTFMTYTGLTPNLQKSSIVIWDAYEDLIDEKLIENIHKDLINNNEYKFLSSTLKERYTENTFYQQSIIIFLYWMLLTNKSRLYRYWPLDGRVLDPLANDVGISSTWEV